MHSFTYTYTLTQKIAHINLETLTYSLKHTYVHTLTDIHSLMDTHKTYWHTHLWTHLFTDTKT